MTNHYTKLNPRFRNNLPEVAVRVAAMPGIIEDVVFEAMPWSPRGTGFLFDDLIDRLFTAAYDAIWPKAVYGTNDDDEYEYDPNQGPMSGEHHTIQTASITPEYTNNGEWW